MEFFNSPGRSVRRLGILAGSFNPPTIAHVELASAAARHHVDQVLWVLPREFPHKEYHGATMEQRLEMLRRLHWPAAVSSGGLFVEIARECREHFQESTQLVFLCGRDAAERIMEWDYGQPDATERMLREFELLVAARCGDYRPPRHLAHRIGGLDLPSDCGHVSSTEVRQRIERGQPWEHLVPDSIVGMVRKIYA